MSTPKGKRTYYPNKVKSPVTTTLTQESHDEITRCAAAVTEANGSAGPECSRADLLEHGWRSIRGLPVSPELTQRLREIPLPEVKPAEPVAETATT